MIRNRWGIILGYCLIAVESISGILFTSILLKSLDNDEYGLYRLVMSWTSVVSILDFGLGGTITRYVVKYKTEKDKDGEQNFLGMAFISYAVIAAIVFIVGAALCIVLPAVSQSIQGAQIAKSRYIFAISILKVCVVLFNHAYFGWFTANERFVYIKGITILFTVSRIFFIFLLLPMKPSAVTVVCIDLLLTIIQLFLNVVFSRKLTETKIKLLKWDNKLFKEILLFTSSIFLGAIINQFNSNVDNIILGMFTTTVIVGLYSSAMQIYTMYSNLSTAIQEVYLPQISKAIFRNENDTEITKELIVPSRLQIVILMLAFLGFIAFGQQFFYLWIGKSYSLNQIREIYFITILVMGSATLQLSQNCVTCVLKAKNILKGKVIITGISTIVNFVLTLVLVKIWGMVGAAIGTAFSMLFGYGIALNIFYKKRAGIDLRLFFTNVYARIWIVFIIILIGSIVLAFYPATNIWVLIIEALSFVIIYFVLIYIIGLKKQEKDKINKIVLSKILSKRKKI